MCGNSIHGLGRGAHQVASDIGCGSGATAPYQDRSQRGVDLTQREAEAAMAKLECDAAPVQIGVVGLGYVGLTTALALLESGASVVGCDRSEARVEAVSGAAEGLAVEEQRRLLPFVATPRLTLTCRVQDACETDAVIICVPTPVDHHLVPDLEPLHAACAEVVENAIAGQVIVLASTTYVGSTRELLAGPLEARGFRIGFDIFVAFSPERVDPGNAAHPQERIPRVVGGMTQACARKAAVLLQAVSSEVHTVESAESAELTKLYENTFRAVNIALANELADIAEVVEVNPIEVIDAAATKPYGFMPFFPGPGVGGHCIPVDPHYLLWQLRGRRASAPVIEHAMSAIAARPGRVVMRAVEQLAAAACPIDGAKVLVVGVTYKPNVADVRSSPALEIMAELRARGAHVCYHDPLVSSVVLPDGAILTSAPQDTAPFDLVVVHTLHTRHEYGWLADHENLLDATFRSLPPAIARRKRSVVK
jgi:UDP-N-acetyl-D-glucosamine dehydrogenase